MLTWGKIAIRPAQQSRQDCSGRELVRESRQVLKLKTARCLLPCARKGPSQTLRTCRDSPAIRKSRTTVTLPLQMPEPTGAYRSQLRSCKGLAGKSMVFSRIAQAQQQCILWDILQCPTLLLEFSSRGAGTTRKRVGLTSSE